jgi:hypothetical protein
LICAECVTGSYGLSASLRILGVPHLLIVLFGSTGGKTSLLLGFGLQRVVS